MVNDYELIYLYKGSRCDMVLQQIINKYRPLIWKKIYQFYVQPKDQDDFYQEATITLLLAINTFDESRNKTFTRYFELILTRRFIALKNRAPKYVLVDKPELLESEYEETYDTLEEPATLSPLEKKVFDLYVNKGKVVSSIAVTLNMTEKSVKNTIYRIKVKIK